MSKYVCLICGAEFVREKGSMAHMKEFDDHVVIKKPWRDFLDNWVIDSTLTSSLKKILKVHGCCLIIYAIAHHFHIEFSAFEGILLGAGLAFVVV